MVSYIKLALKVLTRRKFFTFISLFGITLTLVVLVVATAILDDAFSPIRPESRFDRALIIDRVMQLGPSGVMSVNPGYGFLQQYVLNLPGIERATAFSSAFGGTIYTAGGGRIDARVRRTDANYWKILDFRFVEGRPFTADDEARGAFVAVITEGLREKLFGKAAAAGRSIDMGGQRFTIIGVVPDVPATRIAAYGEMWLPITTAKSSDYRHQFVGEFNGVVLLRSRADIPRVQNDFQAIVRRMPTSDPKNFDRVDARLNTLYENFAYDVMGGPFKAFYDSAPIALAIILSIVAVLFMTLPALNLVTLNLSRILERAPEIGVRKAFGAPRRVLILQFITENVILTLIGGVCAFLLAILAVMIINRSGAIPHAQFVMNARVFFYGMLVAAFFGVFSGAYPAWRMSRLDPVTALRGGAA